MVRQVFHRLPRAGFGEFHGLGDLGIDTRLDLGDVAVVDQTVFQKPPLEAHDGTLGAPLGDLVLVAVELGVEHGMGAEPVGVAFQEKGRPVSRMRAMARRAAASTATTSMPSTRSAAMP
jgi:hypothetical protein